MKELDFLEIIKHALPGNPYIGDDCAYIKDLNIVVTQDSLVEGIHFLPEFSTPYQLGYKSVMINLSDIFASGAMPKYLTISLSLPEYVSNDFVKEFYLACADLSNQFGFEVIGGDITGSDKVFISICAIGLTHQRKIASRSHAEAGDYVVTTGVHGSSAAGLWLLQNNIEDYPNITKEHLMPDAQSDFSSAISTKVNRDYAMMDTSDGLVDALFKIAQASDVSISVDFDKVPYGKTIEGIAKKAKVDFKDWVLYGGEDYQLVACVDEENLKKLSGYTIIGKVEEKRESHFVEINFGDKIERVNDLEKTYNHFKRKP